MFVCKIHFVDEITMEQELFKERGKRMPLSQLPRCNPTRSLSEMAQFGASARFRRDEADACPVGIFDRRHAAGTRHIERPAQ
jgi:hypothetical protein